MKDPRDVIIRPVVSEKASQAQTEGPGRFPTSRVDGGPEVVAA
jgi:hypothetical protein